jgi:hypothetical protein
MSFERPWSILRRLLGAVWVTVMAFLALAEPVHAALGSGVGATLFQAACGALAGCVFAARRSLKSHARRAAALFAGLTREREIGSAVALDGGEHAHFQS